MNTALSQTELKKLLDTAVREVTEDTAGLTLSQGGNPPDENACTVHITFQKGFRSSLSMRADPAMLTRMTKNAIREKQITQQDLEDFTKEYFNVLCGRVSGILYKLTKTASRFSVPIFRWGHFEPEGQQQQFVLNYSDDQCQSAQLIHHIPKAGQEKDTASGTSIT